MSVRFDCWEASGPERSVGRESNGGSVVDAWQFRLGVEVDLVCGQREAEDA